MTQNFYALVSPSQCSHHLWEFVVCEDAFKNKTTQKKPHQTPEYIHHWDLFNEPSLTPPVLYDHNS